MTLILCILAREDSEGDDVLVEGAVETVPVGGKKIDGPAWVDEDDASLKVMSHAVSECELVRGDHTSLKECWLLPLRVRLIRY